MTSLSDKIRKYVTIDTSGQDQDTLECRVGRGRVRTRHFSKQLRNEIDSGRIFCPDGTQVNKEDLQLAFQNALIEATGMCVLEHEYHNLHGPMGRLLEALVRSARGAS